MTAALRQQRRHLGQQPSRRSGARAKALSCLSLAPQTGADIDDLEADLEADVGGHLGRERRPAGQREHRCHPDLRGRGAPRRPAPHRAGDAPGLPARAAVRRRLLPRLASRPRATPTSRVRHPTDRRASTPPRCAWSTCRTRSRTRHVATAIAKAVAWLAAQQASTAATPAVQRRQRQLHRPGRLGVRRSRGAPTGAAKAAGVAARAPAGQRRHLREVRRARTTARSSVDDLGLANAAPGPLERRRQRRRHPRDRAGAPRAALGGRRRRGRRHQADRSQRVRAGRHRPRA